jgi:hypothetical protein
VRFIYNFSFKLLQDKSLGIAVVGAIPSGLPEGSLPPIGPSLFSLFPQTIAIVLVKYLI